MESERVTASYVWFILINPVRINFFTTYKAMKFCNFESILISYVLLENVSTLKNEK